jgi:hypothetical protein
MNDGGRRLLVVLGAASLLLAGCGGSGPRGRAEAEALRRQTRELRRLIAAVDREQIFSSEHAAVGIRQELVRDLIQLTLPIETVVAGEVGFRLEAAEVAFLGGESRVTLRGRVSRKSDPATFAALDAFGGIHGVTPQGPGGHLSARVALDRLEVRATGLADGRREVLEGVVEQLGARALASLAEQIPPLAIPVRFDRTLDLAGGTVGPVEVAAAHLPLRIEVAEVLALQGRLWVLLDVSAGPGPSGGGGKGRS